ncbi:MAG: hypothetical protein MI922_29295, partial [Bacteroidales bacterium]|nr:hypothetical protein [Bacteroidales bacterium]
PQQVRSVFQDVVGLDIDKTDAQAVSRLLNQGEIIDSNSQLRGTVGCLGQVVGNICGVQWTGTTHTADVTLLQAWGSGSERFSSILDGTEVFTQLTQLLGLKVQNPSMSPEQAQPYLAKWTPPDSVYRHLVSGDMEAC